MEVVEQPEVLPATSVAVAQYVTVAPVPTVTATLKFPPVATPVPATLLVQVALVYSLTVDPAVAVPLIEGVVLLDGEAGVVRIKTGLVLSTVGGGFALSST